MNSYTITLKDGSHTILNAERMDIAIKGRPYFQFVTNDELVSHIREEYVVMVAVEKIEKAA